MWRSEPAPAQTTGAGRASARRGRRGPARAGTGLRRPARTRSPRPLPPALRWPRDAPRRAARSSRCRPAGRPGRARRRATRADEDEGLHDLAERAADGVRRRFGGGCLRPELLDPRLRARSRGETTRRARPAPARTSRPPRALTRAPRSGRRRSPPRGARRQLVVAGESIENTISASPPSWSARRPCSRCSRPPRRTSTRPGRSPRAGPVADEHHVRSDLEVDPEAERAAEEQPRLGADRRPRDRRLLPVRAIAPRRCSCSRGTRGSAPRRPSIPRSAAMTAR